mgnify:CR=1 FL=1|tara:strand:+ start:9534 stop:10019 length:486 start_codon:yes stop_codon:yes gene_type:complete
MKKIILFIIYFFIFIEIINAEESMPVDVIANSMEWDDEKRTAYAKGNAEATQGERKLSADELIVYLNKEKGNNEVTIIEALGNVIFINNTEIASGEKAKYDLIENNIIIQNNVILRKNENIMAGEFLEMNLETGVSKIKSKKENERVRVRFSTNNENLNNE